ncbi:hypothetical protein V1498_17515 [Peribacillus sp. SCS-26]|uniref:hypothetical protein n=1 Tax=Paraperibacillus marinus TaxID=3115295 RepID=UPI003905FBFE
MKSLIAGWVKKMEDSTFEAISNVFLTYYTNEAANLMKEIAACGRIIKDKLTGGLVNGFLTLSNCYSVIAFSSI